MKCLSCANELSRKMVGSIELDLCLPGCAGIWLDGGELEKIRNEFSSDEERKQAAEQLFNDMFKVK